MKLIEVRRTMRHALAVLVLIAAQVAFDAAHASAQSDPLEPARRGLVLCDAPVASEGGFTCEGVITYRFIPSGEIFSETRTLVDLGEEVGEVDFVVADKETIKDGMICGDLDPEVVRAGRFERGGQSVSHPLLAELKSNAIAKMSELGVQTVCIKLVGSPEAQRLTVYLDGKMNPELSTDVMWLPPDKVRLRAAE